ncbi:MAG: DUF721 domain-containing protein [Thiotrichales bacterium]|jgi:hypothetical protein|nr:DUF721 domain-containing protein [Thiotrichales bacterium]MBT3753255.1 DUF721 domain-containing protein [Thiotrichales bacterium]MBT3838018.1 DUF721 domain-containing protein [Thiotrichales bacterium]MBT4152107.1 DUF721 domain-containing protein [Thiotrichales bacterium]MBT4262519.1 DUF721 domain-containing protein [Thiotrichales bacterium]
MAKKDNHDISQDISKRHLKKLRNLLAKKDESSRIVRSLRPRLDSENSELELDLRSLPRKKSVRPYGRTPTHFLAKGDSSNKLLRKALYIKGLNQRVIAKLGLPYSAHLRISSINPKGVVTVHASSPAWSQRGRFLQKNILDLLHQDGVRGAKKVSIKVRFSNEARPVTPSPPKQASIESANKLSREAREIGGDLGVSLQRLSNTLLRNRQRRR